ncbi:L,D-transpeptidase [Streptomyces aurantiacus]|uniref:L,D-transpeptidase n=1 Tax=Streptomyces aurantiacus TaxID=47760 RepID=UPI0006E3C148
MPVPARRLPSWAWVTGLTAVALVLVAMLAVRAEDGPQPTASASKKPSPSASAKPSTSPDDAKPVAVPNGSGTGRRIVYSLAQKRVWLVDASDAARRTFAVWPGTVGPAPGTYTVGTRRETTTGSDGVKIENIVFFAISSGVNIAFSNALDGSSPPPPVSGTQTGGVRMKAADGDAVWKFATAGTTVAVVK